MHHVFAHAQDGEVLFRDDVDRREYLSLLGKTARTHGWRVLAYCLMDNHVHIVVETPEGNLGAGMRVLHGTYAAEYNARHGRRGHLFRERYGSVRAQTTEQICTQVTYVAFNPVAAGLCETPDAWRWSSHGPDAWPWVDRPRLHYYFAGNGGSGGARYEEAMEE